MRTMKVSRTVIKNLFLATSLLAGGFLTISVIAQEYVLDPNWPQPLPEGIEWGQVPNVTIDTEGFIYAFHRAEPPILKFSPSGELVDTFGEGWVATAHGFRAAADGTLWATDFNRQNGQLVTQFDTDGKVLLRLGADDLVARCQIPSTGQPIRL